jgi:hypothetical protein
MAIYTKHGKEIIKDSIRVDRDCYHDERLIKIQALVKGATTPQTYYVSDLTADHGAREIEDVVRSNLKKR